MPDIRFYLSLFFRKIHYFLLFTALGAVIGITLAMVLPPTYWASARLLVESEQIPDNLAASTVRTEATEQLQIIQQRILTRENLLEMANRLNIYRPIPGQPVLDLRPDEKVDDLRRRISINVSGGNDRRQAQATIVNVSFSAGSAQLAAQVVNEVVSLILEENVRMRTGVSGQTLEFFEQDVDRLEEELSRRGAQILAFQRSNQGALPDSLDFRRSQLAAAQERLIQVEREQIALQERREGLVNLYESTGRTTLSGSGQETSEEAQLRRLKEQYATAVAVMSMENPRIRVLQSQIDALEKIVAEQAAERSGQIGANGEMLSPYEIQLADLDNQLEFLEARQAQIEGEISALQETIEATPANTIALQTMQRDYENIRTQYDQAVANRARAETGDIIESLSKGQRISVIEQATAPAEPSSPDRPKLIVAGIGGGMMIGLGLIALLEFLNNAVRRPVDITSKLDIVPFATLSFIRTEREIRRRRMMIGAAFLVVLAGIPAGLWAIDVYYMPLDLLLQEFKRKLPTLLAQLSSAPTLI